MDFAEMPLEGLSDAFFSNAAFAPPEHRVNRTLEMYAPLFGGDKEKVSDYIDQVFEEDDRQ